MTGKEAIKEAEKEMYKAIYIYECGKNKGIRKIYKKRAEWINLLLYMAKQKWKENEEKKNGQKYNNKSHK